MPRATDKAAQRLLGILRRGASRSRGAAGDTMEESLLWASYERASVSVAEASDAAQRIASHLAKQRGTVDGLSDRARAAAGRAHELSEALGRVTETFARLELVALNAGLEGARLPEGPGQALRLVAEEVRGQASRGVESARELSAALGEMGGELSYVHGSLEHVRDAGANVAQEATRIGGASSDAARALAEVEGRLRRATGSDPETARALAEAMSHARALATALAGLRDRVPRAILERAVRPVIEALSKAFEGEAPDES